MKHIVSLIFVLLLCVGSFSQGNYTYKPVSLALSLKPDTAISNYLGASPEFGRLSEFEKQFIYYLNYVRKHPREFSRQALVPYLEAYPKLRPNYGESLLAELGSGTALGLIQVDMRLVTIARVHAADLASHDVMSHQSTNGSTTQQRFQNAGVGCGSECINMGNDSSALSILLSLLIDFNVPNLGHRKAILNPKMISVGVGDATNPNSKLHYTVADLGCQ